MPSINNFRGPAGHLPRRGVRAGAAEAVLGRVHLGVHPAGGDGFLWNWGLVPPKPRPPKWKQLEGPFESKAFSLPKPHTKFHVIPGNCR